MIEEASDGSLLKDILKGWEGTTSPLEEWLGAVENTDAYEKLGSATMMEHGTHAYLRKPSELFARSFAQWIALRSGDERLKQNVDNWLNVPSMYTRDVENWNGVKVPVEAITPNHIKYRQWQWDDFEPVAKALDKLFGDLGWLRQEQRRAA